MMYITRNVEGAIVAAYTWPHPDAPEAIDENAAELRGFYQPPAPPVVAERALAIALLALAAGEPLPAQIRGRLLDLARG